MNFKKITVILIIIVVSAGIFFYLEKRNLTLANTPSSTEVSVKFVASTITASGSVVAQDQAKLNFQTGGKLIYLPFKNGDTVKVGQTIARLDTYQLQQQLTAALNTYRSMSDVLNQTKQNSKDSVLKNQIRPNFDGVTIAKDVAIDAAIKRLINEGQLSVDTASANIEIAKYAIQLATLTSPLNGIITQEDVTVPGLNITPTTSFVVVDPSTMVFRANVPLENIYYITEGSSVSISVDGNSQKINGTVEKIYPSKVILPSGEAVYQVDVASPDLIKQAKLDQTGSVMISTNSKNVALVPNWTVLGGQYIWVEDNGVTSLKQVTVGKTFGNEIEITNGLSAGEKIILNPKIIVSPKYQLL